MSSTEFQRKWELECLELQLKILFWERPNLPKPPKQYTEESITEYLRTLSPYLKRAQHPVGHFCHGLIRSLLYYFLFLPAWIFSTIILSFLDLGGDLKTGIPVFIRFLCLVFILGAIFQDDDNIFYLLYGFGIGIVLFWLNSWLLDQYGVSVTRDLESEVTGFRPFPIRVLPKRKGWPLLPDMFL